MRDKQNDEFDIILLNLLRTIYAPNTLLLYYPYCYRILSISALYNTIPPKLSNSCPLLKIYNRYILYLNSNLAYKYIL